MKQKIISKEKKDKTDNRNKEVSLSYDLDDAMSNVRRK
jgi:hypothetical protein